MMMLIFTLLATTYAHAGFQGYANTTSLGVLNAIKCSTGVTCTKVGGKLNIVSSPTVTAGVFTVAGAEATDGILNLQADESDNDADDWAIKSLDAGGFDIQSNATGSFVSKMLITSNGDVTHSGTTPYITIGDAGAEDAGLAFDGNAVDFNISLDDSVDLLTIGVGVAAGTTDAIRIDANQVVTFVQEVLGLGTDSLSGFLQKQVASTTTAITAAQCGSTFVSNSADVMVLPEASTVLGCRLTFVCGTADDFDVDPADGTDVIGITGALAPSAGDEIRCTDIGAGFMLEAVGANLWAVLGTNGTITDVD